MGGRQRRQRLTPEEVADLIAPGAPVQVAPWLLASRISAAASPEIARRRCEQDDRTSAQKAIHARGARRKAADTARANGAAMFNDLGLAG